MKVLSLFANVGFGECYFNNNNLEVVVANELLKNRADFYKLLNPNTNSVICGDICDKKIKKEITEECLKYGPIDLIIATPPCQGMSVANAIKKPNDPRNKLIIHAMEIFNQISAKYMLIENVPQMPKTFVFHNNKAVNIIDYINSAIPNDYKCFSQVLNAKYFNSPQSRKRSISLISKNGTWRHPNQSNKILSLRDSIGHLPSLSNGEHSNLPWHFAPKHNANHVKWMSATPEGQTAFKNKIDYPSKDGRRIKGFMTTYKRMFWDSPAPTVTMTNGSISSQNNVHPIDPRVLSVRELLCVCGLPENYLDRFSHLQSDGSFKYDYPPNFIRKVIGEMFLPNMSSEIIKNIQQ